jgi:hypothetical protein
MNNTTPHHPIYTYHSPLVKLSTYANIVSMAAAIIKTTRKKT